MSTNKPPHIESTGYADSYGGLISALEAKELSQKGKEDKSLRRLDDISQHTKNACVQGIDKITVELSLEEASMLSALGYQVYSELGTGYMVVSWVAPITL